MIERGFRFATTSGQDGNAVMKALTTSSNIQQDGLRQNAEVSGSSGCSECIGDSGSVPLKTEVNYNLKKRKHPAWIWLMLMQQLMTLLLSVHTTTGSKWRTAPVWIAAVLLLLPTGLALDPSKIIAPVGGDKDYRSLRERGICPSVDIRNSIDSLRQLENCTVVEGFVNIVLIEEDKETGRGFLNHSYPKLREISGYLLLYRVYGLGSLKDLFPNLSVIRGQQLFFDFSLVVYEMMALKELGLRSLTDIQRGSVLIEKNPNLCYVESIQWDLITKKGENNFINSNKKPSECRACPDHCPSSSRGGRLCWTSDHCQKVCSKCKDRSCNMTTTRDENQKVQHSYFCCHEECAGGCTGPGSDQCDVCKHVSHNNTCLSTCPTSFYLHYDRRCVTQHECVTMPRPPEIRSDHEPDATTRWKPIEGDIVDKAQCKLECPAGHEEVKTTSVNGTKYYTCKKCNGACPKICLGALVNNIETAQRLKGCSAIHGDLEIQIKGGANIIHELEKNLGDIEEIQGTLKIVRSFPLLSLNFFKRLRVIHGHPRRPDELNGYALVIQDNQNLQQLWNLDDGRNMTILDKMMFHFNPKLCLDLIAELHKKARPPGSPDYLETDVSPWSNGDKTTCNEKELNVTVLSKSAMTMILRWGAEFRLSLPDPRQLLGYVISYIEAPHQNVSYYDGRDACGGDGWIIKDEESENYLMTELKPYTQYALYVQTYTVAPHSAGDRIGARSPIIYARTDPAEPSQPKNLKADATSSSELEISWYPPEFPNGIVTHYVIRGSLIEENKKYYDDQDSCAVSNENNILISGSTGRSNSSSSSSSSRSSSRSSSIISSSISSGISSSSSTGAANGGDCCECTAKNIPKAGHTEKEKEQRFKIEFENYLHNHVYVKYVGNSKGPVRRAKRNSDGADGGVWGVPDEFPDSDLSSGGIDSDTKGDPFNETGIHASAGSGAAGGVGGTAGGDAKVADDDWHNKMPEQVFKGEKLVAFYDMVNVTEMATKLTVTVSSVLHYAEYTIEVVACHDQHFDRLRNRTMKRCSKTAVTSVRSKEIDKYDDISGNITIGEYNYTDKSIKVGWKEPENPNGLIIKYYLEYQRTDANSNVKTECVRHKEFMAANRTKTLVDLTPGDYWIQIRAQSLAKLGNPSTKQYFTIYEPARAMDWRIIFGIVLVALFIPIFFIGIGGYYFIKKRRHIPTITSINPDYHKYEVDGWEVARENVDLIRELGQGSFGMVYEGIVRNVVYQQAEAKCAVKTVNDKASVAERIQFLNEASVMKEFNAHHVVKLLGVVSKAQPTLVIMELMANGDLKTYLRSHRPDCEENIIEGRQPPTLKCILKMAIEIADGMSYLSDKKFVHRDLAARNCMVAEDLTVKIGDFGMTRDIYETDYYRKGGKGLLPVRWMAPESLRDGVFTSQCDVWSYGVVLWEMATLASQPYQGLSNEQVLKYVMDGGVMERPEHCPDRLYDLMKSCWYYQAKHRPTFLDIIADLLPDVPVQFASVSFYHSDVGVVARAAQKAYHEQESRKLNDPSTPLRSSIDLVDDEMYSSRESLHKSHGAYYARDQAFQIDDDLVEEEATGTAATAATAAVGCFELDPQQLQEHRAQSEEEDDDDDENVAEDRCLTDANDGDDHVAVLIPKDQKVYVLVKNPTSNGSKNDTSKGTTTVSSEESKGSYVSNGSASNGYVMGILKQRRQNNTEC